MKRINKHLCEEDRILKRIRKVKSGCWHWRGGRNASGYGITTYKRKTTLVHRMSYLIFKGEIPPGLCVLHSCNTPICCNPDHLRLGTQAENIADMTRQGRQWSKLTANKVRRIRERFARGRITITELAQAYRVSLAAISDIVRFRVWKSLA